MKNIFIINVGQKFAHSGGTFNRKAYKKHLENVLITEKELV